MGYVIVQKSVVEEGWGNTNFAFGCLGKDSVALFAFFESCMHCICLTECVCCLCAGFVCWVKSCCCTLPAVVSHLCDCNDECLQHLPLNSITSGAASRIRRRDHGSMKQTNPAARSKRPAASTTDAHHWDCHGLRQQLQQKSRQLQGNVQSTTPSCACLVHTLRAERKTRERSIFPSLSWPAAMHLGLRLLWTTCFDILLGLSLGQSSGCFNTIPTTRATPSDGIPSGDQLFFVPFINQPLRPSARS